MNTEKHRRPQLTDRERLRGWIFFPLYLLLFPVLLPAILELVDEKLGFFFPSHAAFSAAYYATVCVLLILFFFSFLRHGAQLLLDWLPENLFAFTAAAVGCGLVTFLVTRIPLPVENPILTDYPAQYLISPGATIAVVVILRPLAEEILFRGLVFGSLRKRSRLLAYTVTVPLFALCSVWQFVFPGGPAYLTLALQYLPMSLALTWCFDNGGSIWTPILLRMALEAVGLAIIL